MTKELYLARHGETVWNVQRIIQGWKDGSQKPLTPRGIQQARDLGRFLQDKSIEFVLCGDLWRQQQTAAEILPFLAERTPIKYHSGLRERSTGIQDGVSYAALGIKEEADFSFYDGDGTGAFATAEPLEQVVAKARDIVDTLFAIPQRRILTIGSGWINSYLVNVLLGEPWVYHEQENATVHYFRCGDAGGVIKFELKEKGKEK